jgi:hypothetical protein
MGWDLSVLVAMFRNLAAMNEVATPADPPLCDSCGQPASQALAGPEHGWECRNEACPEFGQAIQPTQPPRNDAAGL